MTDTPAHSLIDALHRLEEELGLPQGFLNSLGKEDDWSFVIKMHALFEAALAYVIGHRLGGEVTDLVSQLGMSGRTSKVKFARALDLITVDDERFIGLLSRLRNMCAHGVRQAVEFSIPGYVKALQKTEVPNFLLAVRGSKPTESRVFGRDLLTTDAFILENAKIQIWVRSLFVLSRLYHLKESEERLRQKEQAIIADATGRMLPAPDPALIAGVSLKA